MYYFVNIGITNHMSGIDAAAVDRAVLFGQHQVDYRLVTMNWGNDEVYQLAKHDISAGYLANQFRYFQRVEQATQISMTVKQLPYLADLKRTNHDEASGNDTFEYIDKTKIEVGYFDNGNVKSVSFFTKNGRLRQIDQFDSLGFVSMREYYAVEGSSNTLFRRDYLDLNGVVQLTAYFKPQLNELVVSEYRLWHYHGHQYYFAGTQAMFAFYLSELMKADPTGTLIVDRSTIVMHAVKQLPSTVKKYFFIHSNHLFNETDSMNSMVNHYHIGALNQAEQGLWDGVFVATRRQAQKISDRWPHIKIFIAPTSHLKIPALVDVHKREQQKIVIVARISPEKNHSDLLRAMVQLHQSHPQAKLDIWGYANGQHGRDLAKAISDAQANDYIRLCGYTDNVASIYDTATLMAFPTSGEGLGRTLIEAQAHGLPVVSYDVEYGPREIIHNGQDGVLIPARNIEALTDAMAKLLDDHQLWQTISVNAHENSKRYSNEAVWQLWKHFFQENEAQV